MAFIRRDFVKETSVTTGTGAIVLAGARAPAQTFASVCANGDTFRYAISNQSGPNEWEVGLGTYNAGANTITRSPVASSNGGGLVNFGVGTKFVDLVVDTAQYNQFLTVNPNISHVGGNSVSNVSLLAFSNASNVTFSLSTAVGAATVLASVAAGGGAGGIAASAAGNSVSAGTVVWSNSNGVSFGMAGSTITAQFDGVRLISVSSSENGGASFSNATTLTLSGGTLFFDRPNINSTATVISTANVMFGFTGSTLKAAAWIFGNAVSFQAFSLNNANGLTFTTETTTNANFGRLFQISASYRALRSLLLGAGVASISTLTDTQATAAQQIILPGIATSNDTFYSLNNVSFKLLTSGLANSVAVYPAAWLNVIASSAAASTASVQNISFSNANGVSFGLATTTLANLGGIGIVTASVAAGGGITNINVSAGTTSQNLSNVVFSNSNGVSFGLNGSTITASVATSLTNVNVSAGTTSQNLSNVVFSNSNGVSFGLNGSTITGSIATSLTNINVSAGTTSQNLSAVVFSNSNGVSFGLNGSTVTGSVAAAGGTTFSNFVPWNGPTVVDNQYGQNSLGLFYMRADAAFQFDRFAHPMQVSSVTATATQSVTLRLGLYTKNASTLSLAASTSFTTSVNVSSNINSTAWNGLRLVSGGWTTTMPAADYWLGLVSSTNTAGGTFSLRNGMYSQTSISFSGYLGSASNATNQAILGQGFFSATTGAMPGSIAFSQINIAGNNFTGAWRNPVIFFHNGTA